MQTLIVDPHRGFVAPCVRTGVRLLLLAHERLRPARGREAAVLDDVSLSYPTAAGRDGRSWSFKRRLPAPRRGGRLVATFAKKAGTVLLLATAAGYPAWAAAEGMQPVAPALERYTQKSLLDGVWKRPGLAPRDRSLVTLSAVIARGDLSELPFHANFAFGNGVKPSEISEMPTRRCGAGRSGRA